MPTDTAVLSDWVSENEPLTQYGPDNLPDRLRAWVIYHTLREIVKHQPGFGMLTPEVPIAEIGAVIGWCHQYRRGITPLLKQICKSDLTHYPRAYGGCVRSLVRVAAEGIPLVDAQIAIQCITPIISSTHRIRFETRLTFLKYTGLYLPSLPTGSLPSLLGSSSP